MADKNAQDMRGAGMSRVVYVTNLHADHDYTPATEYGAIRPVTSGNYPVFQTRRLMEEICDSLAESTDEDFVLISGSSVIAALTLAVWFGMHSQCNLLLFERKHTRESYTVRTISTIEVLRGIEAARERKEAGKYGA